MDPLMIDSLSLSPRVRRMVSLRQPGHSLAGEFYRDPEIYEAELTHVWRRGWLFAGHSCEIPVVGDYFTMNVGDDSILVVRGEQRFRGRLPRPCPTETGHDHWSTDNR